MSDEITYAEGRAMLDEQTRAKLGISVDDFLARLDAGEYRENEDIEIARLAMLVPFVRPQTSEGNDGLTADERRGHAMRYRATAGRRTIGASALAALARWREQLKQED